MWSKVVALILGLLVLGVGAALVYGGWRWRIATTAVIARLDGSRLALPIPSYDERELEGLPDPVARYFRAILRPGQPLIVRARLEQEGEFRTGDADDSWRSFIATEIFMARPPGFVWDARIRMAPAVGVHVRDTYLAGAGSMRGEILGLVAVVDAHDTPEMAAAALQRYLAEAPWIPTALLPSNGVVWAAIDDSSARATLTDGQTSVWIEFRFDAAGDITSAYTPSRYREIKGSYEATPWEGRFTRYSQQGGMRIPTEGEVAWLLPGRRLPYWRGRVTEAAYEYAR
jgi:hypothetical protein